MATAHLSERAWGLVAEALSEFLDLGEGFQRPVFSISIPYKAPNPAGWRG